MRQKKLLSSATYTVKISNAAILHNCLHSSQTMKEECCVLSPHYGCADAVKIHTTSVRDIDTISNNVSATINQDLVANKLKLIFTCSFPSKTYFNFNNTSSCCVLIEFSSHSYSIQHIAFSAACLAVTTPD